MSLRELDKPARDLLRLASVLAAAVVEVLLTKMPQVADIRTHEALKDWMAHARQVSEEAQGAMTADLLILGWVGRHDYQQGAYELARNAGIVRQRMPEANPG
jgi:hypothetical protein